MKILVTGATGFLGSWIIRPLAEIDQVILLVRPESNLWRIENVKNLEIIKSPESDWPTEICRIQPDILILNGWWGVGSAFSNEDRQFENLIRFKLNVDAANKANVNRIIGVGSQAELGPVSGLISENQIDNPASKYGAAKALAHKYLVENSENSIWFRIFSTYGAMDNSEWLFNSLFNNLIANKRFNLTKGEQIWSYLHAYDVSEAMKLLIQDGSVCGTVNVGNPKTETIRDYVLIAAEYLGKPNLLNFGAIQYRPDQVMEMQPITEKLNSLKWKPKVNFSSGIQHTFDWLSGKKESRHFRELELSPLPQI